MDFKYITKKIVSITQLKVISAHFQCYFICQLMPQKSLAKQSRPLSKSTRNWGSVETEKRRESSQVMPSQSNQTSLAELFQGFPIPWKAGILPSWTAAEAKTNTFLENSSLVRRWLQVYLQRQRPRAVPALSSKLLNAKSVWKGLQALDTSSNQSSSTPVKPAEAGGVQSLSRLPIGKGSHLHQGKLPSELFFTNNTTTFRKGIYILQDSATN